MADDKLGGVIAELIGAIFKIVFSLVAIACVVLGFVLTIRGWIRADTNLMLFGVWFTLLGVSENILMAVRQEKEKKDG